MKKYLHLLDEILDMSSSDIKTIIDSGLGIHELIFSNEDYLRECLKLDKSLISKIAALKCLISDIYLNELRKRTTIKGVEDATKYLQTILRALSEEHLVVLFLNNGNALVDQIEVCGSHDAVQVDYRFIVKRALVAESAGIICAHNHPGGNATPSIRDKIIETFTLAM